MRKPSESKLRLMRSMVRELTRAEVETAVGGVIVRKDLCVKTQADPRGNDRTAVIRPS